MLWFQSNESSDSGDSHCWYRWGKGTDEHALVINRCQVRCYAGLCACCYYCSVYVKILISNFLFEISQIRNLISYLKLKWCFWLNNFFNFLKKLTFQLIALEKKNIIPWCLHFLSKYLKCFSLVNLFPNICRKLSRNVKSWSSMATWWGRNFTYSYF